jgi:hypothetical protein
MNAVETLIMQAVLKSVKDLNNSIEMLTPGVKKYFKDNYDEVWCTLRGWEFIDDGSEIAITYDRLGRITTAVSETDIIPTEIIVSIAVELSFNKKI